MSDDRQLVLPVVAEADLWERMLEEIREICHNVDRNGGHKQVAFDLDITRSDLSNALNERNRTELKLRFLPYFLRRRLNDDLPRMIVEACGLTLGETRALTAAEKLARLEEAIGRAGPAGQAILSDAYGRRR